MEKDLSNNRGISAANKEHRSVAALFNHIA
jgi:hypothetical protein